MTGHRGNNPAEVARLIEVEQAELPAPLDGEDAEDELRVVQRLLEDQFWVFAKSMPRDPHWYSHIKRWAEAEDFYVAVAAIRRYGKVAMFRGWPFLELRLGGFVYWTMGYAIRETTIINRKPVFE